MPKFLTYPIAVDQYTNVRGADYTYLSAALLCEYGIVKSGGTPKAYLI